MTSTPTPTSPPADEFSGTAHVKDKDGYTFDVTYSYNLSSINVLTASEKPGFNSVQVKLKSSFAVQNTTPGRDLKFVTDTSAGGPPRFFVGAIFNQNSPVCAAATISKQTYAQWCEVMLAYGEITTDLSAGQSTKLTVYAGNPENGFTDNGGPGPVDAGVSHVPDASLAAVKAALAHPDDLQVIYSAGDAARFVGTCARGAGEPTAAPDGPVFFEPLFSKSGVCHDSWEVPQPHTS